MVVGWFGNVQRGKNRPTYLIEPGAVGDDAGRGREGDQPHSVELMRDVAARGCWAIPGLPFGSG